ncbi:protein of unknown function [Paraburkholderia dioscoreae]|uniref:Uncharacterized protein n=1 Tax=Paraburkholderia dioscoreae TaxID=2604047 RepID=A0A5Q4ZM94_9BURK|nr:protein of unknown function [Paraburkholderia dioscoreae]
MVSVTGWIAPAPTPWISRKAIIAGIDQAKPASTEPIRKIAMPASMTGLRPYRSASLPKTTVIAVCVSRNDEKTQLYRCRSPSCATIWGMAVETMVASMATIAMDAMTAAMTRGRDDCGLRDMSEELVIGCKARRVARPWAGTPRRISTAVRGRPVSSMHPAGNAR